MLAHARLPSQLASAEQPCSIIASQQTRDIDTTVDIDQLFRLNILYTLWPVHSQTWHTTKWCWMVNGTRSLLCVRKMLNLIGRLKD